MKKKLCLLLTLCMILTMTGCGSTDVKEEVASDTGPEVEVASDTGAEEEGASDAGAEVEVPSDTGVEGEDTSDVKQEGKTLSGIQSRGVLRVGTAGDYQPMSFLDPDTGTYVGFDAELAEDLAKALGVELEYVETSWPTLMEDTLAGKFDLAICGITITDARREQALMSTGYLGNGKTVLCRKEDADKYTSLEAIDHPEVRVMENPGGLNEKFARENLPNATLIIHDVNQEIPGLIASGEADVMITEIMEAGFYMGQDERLAAPLIHEPFTNGELGVLMPKGSEDLLDYVNAFLEEEKASGRIDELALKYIYSSTPDEEENAAAVAEKNEYTLEQVVVLSRHNIRSPLSEKGSLVSELTPHTWFEWTSNPGELSLRGAMLEVTMGQYFRLWLEKEGLFPENYIPEDGAVRFYANSLQRTQATARYFSAGLLPVAVVPVECHEEYGQADATFLPLINFINEEYEEDVRSEIEERGGGEGLSGYRERLDDAIKLLMEVTDMEDSEAYTEGTYGDILADETELILEEGKEPGLSGPIKSAVSIADALVLQYYEEEDYLKAAFGHELAEEDWRTIGSVLSTYEDILFASPSLAVNLAHPMLTEVYEELNAEGREFTFLCGHDSTVTSFLAALGVNEYSLPGAIEPTTPIGIKVVFERWMNSEGASFYKVNLVYQSVEQLRSLQPLSLEIPPMIVPISFEGLAVNDDGMVAEEDLLELFEEKIGLFTEMEEEYEAEALDNAA